MREIDLVFVIDIRLDLFFCAIASPLVGISYMVASPAASVTFDEGRAFTGSGSFEGLYGFFIDSQDIIAVYNHAGQVISGSPDSNIGDGLVFGLGDGNAVSIVFINKNYWKIMDCSQIQAFMECAVI